MRAAVAPAFLALALTATASPVAQAGTKPARQALRDKTEGKKTPNVVQNRFFTKAKRFELSPLGGYVPNNPFAKRYIGGILAAYHLSETFAVEGAFLYSPDLGAADLKGLTHTLVDIAHEGGSGEESVAFQQPIDKMTLGATFAARWAPVYGKINLIGERVLNFDWYLALGAGMLSIQKYYAVYSETPTADGSTTALTDLGKGGKFAGNVGMGMDFYLSGSVALKLDARSYLYVDTKPQYDPNVPETESRIYNNFVASAGLSVYFPKMKPRVYNF